jgi:Ni/Co efflux regulator RcnB
MKHVISLAVALSLLGSTAAVAQHDRQNQQNQNSSQRDNNNGQRGHQDSSGGPSRDQPHWSRGDRLPDQYRQGDYVVNDWRGSHLRKPTRGHHWVRVNNQYILVAIGTGLIVNAILNNDSNSGHDNNR